MPFIRRVLREKLDKGLDELAKVLQTVPEPTPAVSYIMLRLVQMVYGSDVMGLIRAIGVLEETKLTLHTRALDPLEQRILLERWQLPDAKEY